MAKPHHPKPDLTRRLTISFDPEILKCLRYRAADEDCSVPEALHRILCGEFERLELINHDPEAAHSA